MSEVREGKHVEKSPFDLAGLETQRFHSELLVFYPFTTKWLTDGDNGRIKALSQSLLVSLYLYCGKCLKLLTVLLFSVYTFASFTNPKYSLVKLFSVLYNDRLNHISKPAMKTQIIKSASLKQ
jgi:hypothetical protein